MAAPGTQAPQLMAGEKSVEIAPGDRTQGVAESGHIAVVRVRQEYFAAEEERVTAEKMRTVMAAHQVAQHVARMTWRRHDFDVDITDAEDFAVGEYAVNGAWRQACSGCIHAGLPGRR